MPLNTTDFNTYTFHLAYYKIDFHTWVKTTKKGSASKILFCGVFTNNNKPVKFKNYHEGSLEP